MYSIHRLFAFSQIMFTNIIGDNRPFLADLYKHVPPSYALHWKALGVSLGFENYQLEMISTDNAHNSDRTLTCFRSMLFQWLCHGKASWGQMEDAINHIRSGELSSGNISVLDIYVCIQA